MRGVGGERVYEEENDYRMRRRRRKSIG